MLSTMIAADDRLARERSDVMHALLSGVSLPIDLPPLSVGVAAWNDGLQRLVDRSYSDEPVSELAALSVGGSIAARVHVDAAYALHAEPVLGGPTVRDAERAFRQAVKALRDAAQSGSLAAMNAALASVADGVVGTVCEAAHATDAQSEDPVVGLDVVRVSQLARRLAAVAAAAVELQRRVAGSRLRASTAGIANRRETLLDDTGIDLLDMKLQLDGLEAGTRTGLLARSTSAVWVDRPERPYTRIDLVDGSQLRVHFKNARNVGVGGSQWLWGRCKAEGLDEHDVLYAVAEFEGPTGDAGEVWESWLQVEGRQAYDIAPLSIHAHAAFAAPGTSAAVLDLTARLDAGEEA